MNNVVEEAVQSYIKAHPRPTYVSAGQAAEMLGIGRIALRRLIAKGDLRPNAVGSISVEQVDALCARRQK